MSYKMILFMSFFPLVLFGANPASDADVKARQADIAKKKAVFEKVVGVSHNLSNKPHPTSKDLENMENGLKWAKGQAQQMKNEFPGLANAKNPVDIHAQYAHKVMDQHIRLLEGEIEATRAKQKKVSQEQMEKDAQMAAQEQAKENERRAQQVDADQRKKRREELKKELERDTDPVIGERKQEQGKNNGVKAFYNNHKTAIWIGSGIFVVGLVYFVAQKLGWIGEEKQPEKETAKA